MRAPDFCKIKPELWEELAFLAFAQSCVSIKWSTKTCEWIIECTFVKEDSEITVYGSDPELEVAVQGLINKVRHYDYVVQKNPKK